MIQHISEDWLADVLSVIKESLLTNSERLDETFITRLKVMAFLSHDASEPRDFKVQGADMACKGDPCQIPRPTCIM